MTIQRYTLGMGREDHADEDEPCLFQAPNGEAVMYADHIVEVSKAISAENALLEACRKQLEDCQAACNKLSAEVEYWKSAHAGLKSAEEAVFADASHLRAEVQRLRDLLKSALVEMDEVEKYAGPLLPDRLRNAIAAEVSKEKV